MRTRKLALIGLGTVGSGVVRLLQDEEEHLRLQCGERLELKWIVVRDRDKVRPIPPQTGEIITELDPVLEDSEVDIAIEVMGTVQPAFDTISSLLRSGKHVITANKAVLAERGRELCEIAHENERTIGFEASVCGGIPIIACVGQSLASNRITKIAGILNGTSNFILSAMHNTAMDFQTALAHAQAMGFAEADPTLDLDGTDAAQKLAILARLGFQSTIDAGRIRRQGIQKINAADIRFASEIGYVIKLLAVGQSDGQRLPLRVAPTLVHKNHPLGQVRGEYNAVQVTGSAVGNTLFVGKGAGMMPTATSVVASVLDLVIGRAQATFRSLRLWEEHPPGPCFEPDAYFRSRFYLRYTISDQPGALAQIAGILGAHGISIASVVQHEVGEQETGRGVPLVVMTHGADEGAVQDALRETDTLPIVQVPTICLPVFD